MAVEHYQNIVIGSGEAGKILSWNLAKQGQKTVVVERSMVGGSCPNIACLPSKNVIYSAKAVSLVDPQGEVPSITSWQIGKSRQQSALAAAARWVALRSLSFPRAG